MIKSVHMNACQAVPYLMNYTLFHTPFLVLNFITILVLLLPVTTLLLNKKCWRSHFIPMAGIFSLFLVSSLLNNQVTDLGDNTTRLASSASFLFLSPLALSFLQFFLNEPDSSQGLKRAIRISLLFYLLAGLGIFVWKGLDEMSGALAIGLGFVLVLMFSMPIFLRQIRISIHQRKDSGKAFMITSIVFSFACYGLIFLMYAAFQSAEWRAELLLLFQLISILFALLMTVGIVLYNPLVPSTPTEKKNSRIPMLTEWEEYSEK